MNSKGVANTWWIIIAAVIALVVMIIIMIFFTSKSQDLGQGLSECAGKGGVCVGDGEVCPQNTLRSGAFSCTGAQPDCCLGAPTKCDPSSTTDCGDPVKFECKNFESGNYCVGRS